jgi:hypothetical protein
MISRPIFHLFLTLSVVIILLGIALIIFTQFDRGYVALDSENKVYAKQNALIKEISQATAKLGSKETYIKNEDQNNNSTLTLIEHVKQDDSKVDNMSDDQSQTVTAIDQEIARINHLNQQNYRGHPAPGPYPYSSYGYDDYQNYWLSNNPWSPDYNPNRRY